MNIRAQVYGETDPGYSPVVGAKRPKGVKDGMLHSIPVLREESRRSDTRLEDRHASSGESAALSHNGSDYDIELINVGGGGAMVRGDLPVVPWDRISLHLGDEDAIDCAVLWIKDGRIGLEFAHETKLDCSTHEQAAVLQQTVADHFPEASIDTPSEPPAESLAEEQRTDRRHPLIWSGILHYDYASTPARLRNISEAGAMIETSASLTLGAEPLLDLAEAGSIFATVIWVAGDHAGLRFNQRFDLAQLAKSRPQVASGNWEPPEYLKSDAHSRWDNHWNRMSLTELSEEFEGFLKR